MTLMEKLAEAKSTLAEVKKAVEDGEKGADELSEAIEGVKAAQAKVDAANEAQELLKGLYAPEGTKRDASDTAEKGTDMSKSIGEFAAEYIKGANVERGKKVALAAPVYRKDAAVQVTPSSYAQALTTVDPAIREGYRPRLVMADLFSQAQISNGNSVTYYRESATIEGGFAGVAENGEKPQISFGDPVEVSETLKKVAGYYKVSDEVLDDAKRLADNINGRALYKHDDAVDSALLNGDGTGANIKGVLNTSGIQAKTGAIDFDSILDAIAAVEEATGFAADAIVMNPGDYNKLLQSKDENKQYYIGGPFLGEYGNGTIATKPPIWGVPVVTTPKMASGTALVGAFKQGGTVFRKDGTQVSVYNQNEDDAIHNRLTIVVESRLALAIEYPAAFVKMATA